jgi:hypothetical protein
MNKTIVITYDDATRMVDFCKDSEGNVSKEFYDWYLGTGHYFAKTGMLIIDDMLANNERLAVSFDFTDPDKVEFNLYKYRTQKIICNFFFHRQENLTMDKVSVDIKYLDPDYLKRDNIDWYSPETRDKAASIIKRFAELKQKRGRSGARITKEELLALQLLRNVTNMMNLHNCRQITYFTYALMYFVLKQEPEEITTLFNAEINKAGEKVTGIYKYTGYIDLRKNKTYKPLIPKDPDDPKREYQRHIQAWTVRGHYRHINGKKIWIEPHVKGKGEIEKRIYGTEDESDVKPVSKVFEVERTKSITKAIKAEKKQPGKIEYYVNKFIDFFRNLWIKAA